MNMVTSYSYNRNEFVRRPTSININLTRTSSFVSHYPLWIAMISEMKRRSFCENGRNERYLTETEGDIRVKAQRRCLITPNMINPLIRIKNFVLGHSGTSDSNARAQKPYSRSDCNELRHFEKNWLQIESMSQSLWTNDGKQNKREIIRYFHLYRFGSFRYNF